MVKNRTEKVTVEIRKATKEETEDSNAMIAQLNKEHPIDKIPIEKELRRYVKREGGYRKGLSSLEKKRAQHLRKLLGRKELAWDKTLIQFS